MAITCTEGEVKISEFGSVRSKQSQTISLQEYVNKVRSNTFKAQVEEYRRLAALPGLPVPRLGNEYKSWQVYVKEV